MRQTHSKVRSAALTCIALSLSCSLSRSAAQTSSVDHGMDVSTTKVRGYWIDPATGLMWAAKDNGKDVRWKKAVKYCRDLKLAGHSDWRLASIGELASIYDPKAEAAGLAGPHDDEPMTWHVKGSLFLSGNEWSSSERLDDRGRPSGYAWYYDFNEGRPDNDPTGFPYPYSLMRALCVRSAH